MRCSKSFWGAAALALATLVGCGSDDDGGGGGTTPPTGSALSAQIAAAARVPANDSATSSSSAFKVLQDAGVPAVVVTGAPKVNFTVFSDGAVRQGLTLSNMSFIIAKLAPATGNSIEEWVSYTYRTEIPAANVGPGGKPVLASAIQATTSASSSLVHAPSACCCRSKKTKLPARISSTSEPPRPGSRPLATTAAPSRAKSRAVARPIPLVAPVMTAALPVNRPISWSSSG